ncbi:hypothetical protein ACM39_06730 [Chryseobacterium sp. FH2]|uniref:FN3 associated domain-containing protein n=1 Tax=Chryseobacterium sp. FH2 TaxID=1674291 RepID=UPI00065B0636|nr:FN3 associated domain-containing protein [Chryseobacterium sp. FH2]KMQ68969.1 hypothetical protein ACM39_06730 [Chryseobacterium sp. FH2]
MKIKIFILLFCFPAWILSQNLLQVEINNQNNDVEVMSNNTANFISSDLELAGKDGANLQETFLRFDGISLPSDAVINNVYLVFYGDEASTSSTVIKITGEIGSSPPYPASTAATTGLNLKSRNYSGSFAEWITSGCQVNQQYQSPDLKNIVQEMFPNNSMNDVSLAFRIQGSGQGAFTVKSYSGATGYRPKLVINYSTQTTTVNTVISTGNNDAEQVLTTGNIDLGSGVLELGGKYGNTPQISGLRFENVQIPAGAQITNAYIEFYSYGNNVNNAELTFRTELGSPAAYTTANNNIAGRSYSLRKVKWITDAWTTSNTKYKSANLKEIIDETRLNGWQPGQALAFKVEGNDGYATAWSREGNVNYQPRLVIEYLNNGAGPGVGAVQQDETIRRYVSSGNNDAEQVLTTGNMDLGSGVLELGGKYGNIPQTTAIRFENIQLPDNAYVADAYIEFYAYGNSTNAQIKVYSEDSDAAVYTTASENITKRNYSTIFVDWNTGNWVSNSKYRTANLRNVVDQIRMNGWHSGNSLAFKLESASGGASVYSRNGSELYQPRLVIEYLNNNTGPVIEGIETNPANMNKLYINEVSSEGTQIQDEDWLEIYNDHDYPVYFKNQNSGIYLSDKNGNRTLSELKNIYIPAKGFGMFIADSDPAKGNNHLNFGLSADGETIYLSRKVNGTVIQQDVLTYQNIPFNQSFGRFPNGTGSLTSFIKPTYNASNNDGKQRLDLNFSKKRGVYDVGFDLTISAQSGTTIKYTLDGKTPSATVGMTYTAPITINKTSAVKVYAYDSAGNNSGVIAHTYVLRNNYANETALDGYWQWLYKSNITADEYAQAIGEVPIVSVTTNSEPNTLWAEASVEYIDNNVYSGRNNFFSNSLTRKFGQESVGFYNPNLKFKFNADSGVKKANYTFFDDYPNDVFENPGKIQSLELKQGQDNASRNVYNIGFMRFSEKISMNLQKEMGKYALNTRYINLFINGKYRGLKTMRNDFNPNNLEEIFGDDDDNYTKVNLQDGYFTSGIVEAGDGSQAVWNNIKSIAANKKFQEFKKLVDVDDLIKFQIMFMFTDTENEATAITHNTNPDVMKTKFMINDTDGSFFGGITYSSSDISMPARGFAGGGGNYKQKWLLTTSRNGPGGLFGRFMGSNTNVATGNLEFKTLVKDAVLQYMGPASGNFTGADGATLSVANVQNKIQTVMNELDRLYKLDAAYMGYTSNVYNQWKNIDGPRIIGQVPERVSFSLKKWLEYNMAHTLLPAEIPTLDTIKTTDNIQINNPNPGTQVYYTLNGTDPMGNDGIVSQDAHLYSGEFNVPVGTYAIVARSFGTNNWGPKFSKTIKVEDMNSGKFVITGINYKPQSDGDAEFLMVTNSGSSDLDVSGYTISDAVTYTFPQGTKILPNQTIMLVKNPTLITGFDQFTKYQWASGSLSNSGEPVTFKDKSGNTVDYVFFSSVSPWPVQANGQGYYLKLISPDLNNELPESWEAVPIVNVLSTAKMSKSTEQKSVNIIPAEKDNETKIYPVPMKEVLFVSTNEKSVIAVYNMAGQFIKMKTFEKGTNALDVSELNKGGYLIKIQGEKHSKVFKAVKE